MRAFLPWLFSFATIGITQGQVVNLGKTDSAAYNYYQLGLQYKNGKDGKAIDYAKAYEYFSKAAALGHQQSVYGLGYLSYKGLGCNQDYTKAALLFKQGALAGRDNSMYFYSLCLRNSYGVAGNEDSAKYWLQKAADLGYKQAIQELNMQSGENANTAAKALASQIQNAALPEKTILNQYRRVEQKIPVGSLITGDYTGYLLQYDWSGQNLIESKTLELSITENNGTLTGKWSEQGTDSLALQATLTGEAIAFTNTQYRRKDHYSPDTAILYHFSDAHLSLLQNGDSIYLAGNVTMFSPERKEPSKPITIALVRSVVGNNNVPAKIGVLPQSTLTPTASLKVYPNPFTNSLSIDLTLTSDAKVEIQLISLSGSMVYRKPAEQLKAGKHVIPLSPSYIAPGTYLLRLQYGEKVEVVKVIKR